MIKYKFTIEGKPVPKGRPRFANGKVFTPAKTRDFENHVKLCFIKQCKREKQLTGPLKITIKTFIKKPVSRPDDVRPIGRGSSDIDNLCKSIMDGMNGIVYKDDSQVVVLHAAKFYDDNERAEVIVETFE